MTHVFVTGSDGFIGRNLTAHLQAMPNIDISCADIHTPAVELRAALKQADVVVHLAGVNRPHDPGDFLKGNRDFTAEICQMLRAMERSPKILFSSSIQANLDNPYGQSKRAAEAILSQYSSDTGAAVRIYRLKNLFGKWSRPNYNSVVATFCHNIAIDLPIQISDPACTIDLTYIDDVIELLIRDMFCQDSAGCVQVNFEQIRSHVITLADLAGTIQSYHDMRHTLAIPDFSVPFYRQLYATYLSYVSDQDRETQLQAKSDLRGSLAELLKSPCAGQIFVSRTRPGVVRGNHYHHTKTEKFLVVEGQALLRMRRIADSNVVEYRLWGDRYQVVDIPPGFAHSLENVGLNDLVTLFWASEVFDPNRPDTYYYPVLTNPGAPKGGAQ